MAHTRSREQIDHDLAALVKRRHMLRAQVRASMTEIIGLNAHIGRLVDERCTVATAEVVEVLTVAADALADAYERIAPHELNP